jgi:hypothetical protein
MVMARPRRIQSAKQVKTGTVEVDRATGVASDAIQHLLERPIARVAIQADLIWGLNKLDHGMGEEPFGFHATTDSPEAVVTSAQVTNPFPSRQLWVRLTGAAYASVVLWVY